MKTQTSTTQKFDYSNHTIAEIAHVCCANWTKLPIRGTREFDEHQAGHYLNAMFTMETIDDGYGCDTGDTTIRYFLSNVSSWRGDVARSVKAELHHRLDK